MDNITALSTTPINAVGGLNAEVPVYTGDILQRIFDRGYVDNVNSALQKSYEMNFNAYQAELNRLFSADEAQKNREFQERMSNTAYQRAITDLKKSGLNPYLVISNGGASSPSGATASGSSASYSSGNPPNYGTALGDFLKLVGTAIQVIAKKR